MPRERVAVVGGRGLFEESVTAALASSRRLRVRRFTLDAQGMAMEELGAFQPDVIVAVTSLDQPIPPVLLPQVEKGVTLVTLDPREPTMSFPCRECEGLEMCKAPATLEGLLGAVRAARVTPGGNRALETAHWAGR